MAITEIINLSIDVMINQSISINLELQVKFHLSATLTSVIVYCRICAGVMTLGSVMVGHRGITPLDLTT